jgi:hypothetical protein
MGLKLNKRGMILVPIIIMLPFIIMLTVSFLTLTASSFGVANKDNNRIHAQFSADAGVDYAVYEISENEDWAGTASPIVLQENDNVKTTYEVTVSDIDEDHKLITSTGKTYNPATNTTPKSTITIKTTLRAVRSGSNYSVVTGVGGLYMTNSAKILGGNVLVNGEITMSNTAQIGLSNNPVEVNVAHQICPYPADETYPRICNPGERGEPISIFNSAKIYGSVSANNQVDSSGMVDPGLIASSGVTAGALPTHNRAAQKAGVANEMSGTEASCWKGSYTWPANLKINGNVNISNKCKVTIEGDVWITGNFYMSNSTEIIVSDSLGATRPNIMVDGNNVVFSNGATIVSNSQSTGAQVISYWSNTSCSPDCADVTGVDLDNSRDVSTINFSNTASGPNSVFYARWSQVNVNNSGQLGALVGQTIRLSNSSTITFGTTADPGQGQTYWIISEYQRDV